MTDNNNRAAIAGDLRARAEEIARKNATESPQSLGPLSPAETVRAIHELRVHQIELEMQNDELIRTQVELIGARALF